MRRSNKFLVLQSSRGDTSVLLTFLILAALLLGATALTVLSIGNLRGAGNIAASSQALYAADVGVERGLNDFRWTREPEGDPRLRCSNLDNEVIQPGTSYQLFVHSDEGRSGCPRFSELQGNPPQRALCIEAIGKTRGGAVRRRVANDTDSARCDAVR